MVTSEGGTGSRRVAATRGTSAAPGRGGRGTQPLLAYVLHRYDWSETSLIVELFTRDQGRVVVAAKGAKRPTSQLRPVLLPFQPLLALLGKTPADEHAEVHNLRGAEWAGGRALLGPAALFGGFYLNELLLKLLPRQDAHPTLFDAYADTLQALACGEEEATLLRAFELVLLREMGVLPELATATLTTAPVLAAQAYALHPEAGLIAAADGLPGAAWAALEAVLCQVQPAGELALLRRACAPVAAALRTPLRGLLHYHLGHTALRTRQVWQGVQRLAEAPAR